MKINMEIMKINGFKNQSVYRVTWLNLTFFNFREKVEVQNL